MRCIICDLCDLVTKDYRSQVLCKLRILVRSQCEVGHFICKDYNISTKMICLDHGSGDF